MKRKNTKTPRIFQITDSGIDKFAAYQNKQANEIYLHIGERTSEFRTPTIFTLVLNVVGQANFETDQQNKLLLCKIWIYWPPTEKYPTKLKPLLIQRNDSLPSNVRWDYNYQGDKTCFYLDSLPPNVSTIRFTFESPSVFFLDEEIAPFKMSHLNIGMNIYTPSEKTLIFLEFPRQIALRVRRDNSEYHSHTLGLDKQLQRRTTYFEKSDNIWMQYTFGTADSDELSAPILLLFRAALGFIFLGIGFSLFSQYRDQPSVAIPFLVIGLAPWFIEAFQRVHLISSSSSANLTRPSWSDYIVHNCFILQIILIIVTVLSLLNLVALSGLAEDFYFQNIHLSLPTFIMLLVGIFLLLVGGFYFAAFSLGIFLGYACDCCGKTFRVRKLEVRPKSKRLQKSIAKWLGGVWQDDKSRRALCYRCHKHLKKIPKICGCD